MDRPHEPLDRMVVHPRDRFVGRREAVLEEQRDVDPGEGDDAEEEDADRAGVGERIGRPEPTIRRIGALADGGEPFDRSPGTAVGGSGRRSWRDGPASITTG